MWKDAPIPYHPSPWFSNEYVIVNKHGEVIGVKVGGKLIVKRPPILDGRVRGGKK